MHYSHTSCHCDCDDLPDNLYVRSISTSTNISTIGDKGYGRIVL
jgi:hypothetical protein